MKKSPKVPKKRKGYQTGGDVDEFGNPILDANGNPITSGTNMLNPGGTEFKTTGDYSPSMKEATANTIPTDTTTPTTEGQKKGGKGFDMGNMAWLQYANMAQEAVRQGNEKNLERVTDPKTGKTYTKYKNDNALYTESFAEPTHEKVLGKAKEGDWKGVAGQIFGGHLYDLYDKNKQQKEFGRIQGEQKAQEAIEAREQGQTMTTVQGSEPVKKEKLNEKLGNKVFGALGLKTGGEIKGAGTGTSDSINAELEEGGFVVPAKNNPFAKMIRKNVLGDNPNKKAKLHKGNVPVKVSDGEHFFTEKEKEEIEAELGEEFLESLAPEAEEGEEKAKGGELSAEKARKILHDKTVNGQSLTDKQRRYFGWIAGGRKMATGGDVEGTPNTITSKQAPTKSAEELNKLKQEGNFELGNKKAKPTYKKPKKNLFAEMGTIEPVKAPDISLATKEKEAEILNPTKNAIDTTPVPDTRRNSSFWDKVNSSGALDYGLAAFQTGMGLKGASEKRPVAEIDKTFSQNVDKAQAQAGYGLTPEQRFLVDQQNQNLLNQEIFAAKNFAGGSASNAYNMTRSALNNAFMRNLQTQVTDTGLQQDKQAIAADLAARRAIMGRQIFQDSLDAFNQKQVASAQLTQAGLSNALSAKRYQDFMKMREQENMFNNNPWLNQG